MRETALSMTGERGFGMKTTSFLIYWRTTKGQMD
jgi:hypothetical protein